MFANLHTLLYAIDTDREWILFWILPVQNSSKGHQMPGIGEIKCDRAYRERFKDARWVGSVPI